MRRVLIFVLWLGVGSALGATLIGALAPTFPYFEIVNHFRPLLVGATFALAVVACAAQARLASRVASLALAGNLILALLPLLWRAPAASERAIRITTFNVWVGNRDPDAVVKFLRQDDADIVILQEVDTRLEKLIVPSLQTIYPHAVSCARRNCGLVLLSKRPWLSSGYLDRRNDAPPVVWARFAGLNKPFVVTGLHLAYPFQPLFQVAHTNWLIQRLAQSPDTQIVVGDFNLTPYSWKLNALANKANLRRHATFGASWPGNRWLPFVLLDNLLASPAVRSAAVHYGPFSFGSDHRPVSFDIVIDGDETTVHRP